VLFLLDFRGSEGFLHERGATVSYCTPRIIEVVRISIASDHAGFELKQALIKRLTGAGWNVTDLGAHSYDASDDYPDFAEAVGRSIQANEADRAILLCGSGVGASIAANKMKGVRAGLCHDTYSGHQGVEHDDMNVLVIGSRVIGVELSSDIIESFLKARFTGEERHRRRLEKTLKLESEGHLS
jgi:ribose 5-phosphate isomerase B